MKLTVTRLDPEFKRHLTRYFSIGAVFYVLAAVIQTTYYQPDQHFQTLEFADFRIHPTNERLMPWEYHQRVRPWTQPGAYAVAIRGLEATGVANPFTHDRLLRLGSAVLGLGATILFCITLADWLPLASQRKWLAIVFGLFWFFPSFHTRTSSENLASIFLVLGLSALFLLRRNRAPAPPPDPALGPLSGPLTFSNSGLLLSGLLLGLSFNSRYQLGIVIAAVGLWLLLVPRVPFRQFVVFGTGVLATIGLGILIDWWGYGTLQLTPWNYLQAQVLHGRAASFGVNPWYHYLQWVPVQPMGIVLLVAVVLFWLAHPRNVLTWTSALFVGVHVFLAHKEVRFLTPITHLSLAMLLFVIPRRWYLLGDNDNPFLGHARWSRIAFYVFAAINLILLVGASVRGPRIEVAVHQAIYRDYPDHFEFYSLGISPYVYWQGGLRMEFYAPPASTHHVLGTMAELDTVLARREDAIWYHDGNEVPATPDWPAFHDHCTMVYQSYGRWMSKLNVFGWQDRQPTTSLYRCRRL